MATSGRRRRPRYKEPSPAQLKARERAWRIMRLRGAYGAAPQLFDADRATAVKNLIHAELSSLGASTKDL